MIKSLSSLFLGLLLLAGISVDNATGQTTQPQKRNIYVGVLNGRAESLPKPEYPIELRNAGIEGIVAVAVTIDQNGSVTFAEAELYDQRVRKDAEGNLIDPVVVDPQLRASAEFAARGAKFQPSFIDGSPVTVKGKIVYNFIAKTAGLTLLESTPTGEGPKVGGGGLLNGKAISLPLPEYPAAAKAVKAQGAVSVQVVLDEEGNVMTAQAVSGHPLLRAAAEAAARQAKFAPTMLSGVPVRVSGVLVYNFVA